VRVVALAGSFNGWGPRLPFTRVCQFDVSSDGLAFQNVEGQWSLRTVLPVGDFQVKFVVDGQVCDILGLGVDYYLVLPKWRLAEWLPSCSDGHGNTNNMLHVEPPCLSPAVIASSVVPTRHSPSPPSQPHPPLQISTRPAQPPPPPPPLPAQPPLPPSSSVAMLRLTSAPPQCVQPRGHSEESTGTGIPIPWVNAGRCRCALPGADGGPMLGPSAAVDGSGCSLESQDSMKGVTLLI